MKALDLGKEKVFGTVIRLAVPAMIAQFINVLYSIVDRIFVGNIEGVGDLALAGVGVCAPVTTLISSFAFLVGLGGGPIFAISLGEGRPDNAKKILANAFLMLAILSVIITGVILASLKPLLMTFGASEATYPFAREYMFVYACGAVFSIVSLGLNQFVIAQGYSGLGMLTTSIGAVANVILDPIFIFTCGMGIKGAALATILSQAMSMIFVLCVLLSKRTKVRLSLGGYKAKIMLKTLLLGVSPFLIMATDSVIIIVLNAVLQKTGGAAGDFWITVATVVQAFLSLITMPMLGISTGTQPVLSFNYGARNITLIRKAEKIIVSLCLAYTTLMFALSWGIAEPFVKMFTSDPETIEKALWGIKIYMIGIIPLSLQYAFVDGLTALEQPQFAITLSMTRKLVFMLGATILLPIFFGVQTAFYAEPIADVASAVLSTCVFLAVFPRLLKKRAQMLPQQDDLSQQPQQQ